MGSDWDFLAALSATAGVIALAVLAYVLLAYRRGRAQRRLAALEEAPPSESDPKPVFFKRYTGDADGDPLAHASGTDGSP